MEAGSLAGSGAWGPGQGRRPGQEEREAAKRQVGSTKVDKRGADIRVSTCLYGDRLSVQGGGISFHPILEDEMVASFLHSPCLAQVGTLFNSFLHSTGDYQAPKMCQALCQELGSL